MTWINHETWPSRSLSSESVPGIVIIAVGIDAVHIPRFAALVARRPSVVDRLFTTAESQDSSGRVRSVASLAARFAAKEAVAKALGAPAGLVWHDCTIISQPDGRPVVEIHRTVAAAAADAGVQRWHVSLTHDGDYAAAYVIAEGDAPAHGAPHG